MFFLKITCETWAEQPETIACITSYQPSLPVMKYIRRHLLILATVISSVFINPLFNFSLFYIYIIILIIIIIIVIGVVIIKIHALRTKTLCILFPVR